MKTFSLPGTQIIAPNVVLSLMPITEKTDDDDVRELVRTARDAGINFFDHADAYGSGPTTASATSPRRCSSRRRGKPFAQSGQSQVHRFPGSTALGRSGVLVGQLSTGNECGVGVGSVQLLRVRLGGGSECRRADNAVPIAVRRDRARLTTPRSRGRSIRARGLTERPRPRLPRSQRLIQDGSGT